MNSSERANCARTVGQSPVLIASDASLHPRTELIAPAANARPVAVRSSRLSISLYSACYREDWRGRMMEMRLLRLRAIDRPGRAFLWPRRNIIGPKIKRFVARQDTSLT